MLSSRQIFFLGFLFCTAMLAIAGYFQFIEHYEPCPLCIIQRVLVLAVAVVMLLAVIHHPATMGVRIYSLLSLIFSVAGAVVSARHVWIQHLPADQVPMCGPGLSFMLDNYPLADVIKRVLTGSGECAEVVWTFLGLSIPAWTCVAFIFLALLSFSQLVRR